MDEKFKEIKEELTLLLIYLTGWEEDKRNAPGEKVWRAWKGYNFDVLNNLQTKKWIYQIPGGKSVTLEEKGKQEVELLLQKYTGVPVSQPGEK